MRIIIYAMGRIFNQYKDELNWNSIIALCDKNKEAGYLNYGEYNLPIVLPNNLCELEYDFVVVFSNIFFEEMKQELVGEYFIPRNKIISWREIIEGKQRMEMDVLAFCRLYFKAEKYKRFLDIGMNILPKKYLTKAEMSIGEDIILDGILSELADINENLYDNVYKNCNEIKDYYDIAFLWDESRYTADNLNSLGKFTKYLIFGKRRYDVSDGSAVKEKFQQIGNIKCISTVEGDFWVIDTKKRIEMEDVSIYVVMHRKYNFYLKRPYIPICVGDYQEKGYLIEQKGENIAYLNKKINECTALYWIWKNTKSEYVGLNHYRRYFYNNEVESMDNYLDFKHIKEIFKEYDIILPKTYPLENMTMLEQIKNSMNPELCQEGYCIIKKGIEKKQPEYLQAFDNVMNGHVIFNCNIFVTKREVLNRYCEWLFSFLIEAAEQINVEGYDSYSQRVIGFFAERMWTIWLRKNKLCIKELPYVLIR